MGCSLTIDAVAVDKVKAAIGGAKVAQTPQNQPQSTNASQETPVNLLMQPVMNPLMSQQQMMMQGMVLDPMTGQYVDQNIMIQQQYMAQQQQMAQVQQQNDQAMKQVQELLASQKDQEAQANQKLELEKLEIEREKLKLEQEKLKAKMEREIQKIMLEQARIEAERKAAAQVEKERLEAEAATQRAEQQRLEAIEAAKEKFREQHPTLPEDTEIDKGFSQDPDAENPKAWLRAIESWKKNLKNDPLTMAFLRSKGSGQIPKDSTYVKDQVYDGCKYTGQLKDGKPNGPGRIVTKEFNIIFEGQQQNGILNGYGREFYYDGGYRQGTFNNGHASGLMTNYKNDGTIIEEKSGMYDNNRRTHDLKGIKV